MEGINHTVNKASSQLTTLHQRKSFQNWPFYSDINVGSMMKACRECETYNYTSVIKEVQCEALCQLLPCLNDMSGVTTSTVSDSRLQIINTQLMYPLHAKFQCWVYRLSHPRFKAPSSNPQPKGTLVQSIVIWEVLICPESKGKVKFILCLLN